MIKRLKSKTYWLAILMGGLTLVESNIHLLRDSLGDNWFYVYVGFSILAMVIREATTKPIREK
jgi:hypothetical protein